MCVGGGREMLDEGHNVSKENARNFENSRKPNKEKSRRNKFGCSNFVELPQT